MPMSATELPPHAPSDTHDAPRGPHPLRAPVAAATPYLRLHNLSKRFGSSVAVDDVSLDIERGEFVCILGPSGCGKTTLLRAICGLDPQSFGRIEQDGRDISQLPPAARDFGIVFQSYALFPNLTVAQNVAFGLENRRQPRAAVRSRVAELLELVGLQALAGRFPSELSGGQQQRVALARALALAPGLLLLDEPLSALDARVRVHLRHEIRALQRRLGLTTLMITHDQEEAITMADRIVVMNRGRIEQIGTPEAIYCEPATPFVAGFVGTMNFIDAEVDAIGRARIGEVALDCTVEAFPGTPVRLAVRPEDVLLSTDEDALHGIAVEVRALEFLGPVLRLTLGDAALGARTLYADLPAAQARQWGLSLGVRLMATIEPTAIRVFPHDGAGA